jgi:hypothetical protein
VKTDTRPIAAPIDRDPAASRLLLRANLRLAQQWGSLSPEGVSCVASAFGRPSAQPHARTPEQRREIIHRLLHPRPVVCTPRAPLAMGGWDPSLLADLCHELAELEAGVRFRQRVLLFEPDAATVAATFGSVDLRENGVDLQRLVVFTGPTWVQQLRQWLTERIDHALPRLLIDAGAGKAACHQAQTLLNTIGHDQMAMTRALSPDDVACPERGRLDPLAARAMLAEAARGERSLTILVLGSQHTTYVRHSLQGLCQALQELGHRVHLFDEPDVSTVFTPLAYRRVIEQTTPDLIVLTNYPRLTLKGAAPNDIPFVCWLQDAMPHLFQPEAGASINDTEMLIGNALPELSQDFGYPAHAMASWCVPACDRRFHPGRVEPELRLALACDVAFVSNHSESVDAMCARLLSGRPENDIVGRLILPLRRALADALDQCVDRSPREVVDAVIKETACRVNGKPLNESAAAIVRHSIAIPLMGRMFRHQALGWAADICQRRGWSMRIYGNGWEDTPGLADLAAGPIEHGERLRACYQTARVHLHLDQVTLTHQRVFECAMSGGLPIARFHRDALYSLEAVAADEARDLGAARWEDCPLGARYLQACAEHRVTPRELRAVMDAFPPFGRRARETTGTVFDAHWLYAGFDGSTFTDPASLERLLERAITDPAWRDARSAAMRERMVATVSTRAFAKHMLARAAQVVGLRQAMAQHGRPWPPPRGWEDLDLPCPPHTRTRPSAISSNSRKGHPA